MTPESTEIAAELDTFPEWARQRMRDSFMRLIEAYAATTMRTPLVRVSASNVPSNVVSLRDYRSRAG